jgi:hypothetical protein
MFAAVTEDQLKEFYLMWMERCLELERVVSERQGSCIGALEIYDLGYTRPGVLSFALSHCRFLSAAGVGMSQLHSKGLAMMSRVLGLGQACLGHRLPCWHASPSTHDARGWHQVNYPENLAKSYIISAPRIFSYGWKVRTPAYSALFSAQCACSL